MEDKNKKLKGPAIYVKIAGKVVWYNKLLEDKNKKIERALQFM